MHRKPRLCVVERQRVGNRDGGLHLWQQRWRPSPVKLVQVETYKKAAFTCEACAGGAACLRLPVLGCARCPPSAHGEMDCRCALRLPHLLRVAGIGHARAGSECPTRWNRASHVAIRHERTHADRHRPASLSLWPCDARIRYPWARMRCPFTALDSDEALQMRILENCQLKKLFRAAVEEQEGGCGQKCEQTLHLLHIIIRG